MLDPWVEFPQGNATMRQPGKKRNFSLAILLAALVAAGALVPIAWQHRRPAQPEQQAVRVPTPAPAPVPDGTVPAVPLPGEPDAGVASTTPAPAGQDTQVAAAPSGAEDVP